MGQSSRFPIAIFFGLILAASASAQQRGVLAWWTFDEGNGSVATDKISKSQDRIARNFKFLPAVSGTGLKFDGFTTRVVRAADSAPRLSGSFALEAWIAIQEYPLNWVAIIDHERHHQAGYFFGIDAAGRLGLQLSAGGKWQVGVSDAKLSLMTWHHVAASFEEGSGIELFVDGRPAGKQTVEGRFTPAEAVELWIGKNHEALPPTDLVRPAVSFPALYSFDGIIDELKIYGGVLPAQEVAGAYAAAKPREEPPLFRRTWPRLTAAPGRFGAVYDKLNFYEEWDALWRNGAYSDIVVGFDEVPYKFAFWHGTNYNGNLVSENGIWVGDQSVESSTKFGCAEHMSDKQDRYSHVRLLENHDVRVVVHWRYALTDVTYAIARVDPETGWGEWADEYYYIYPDGVAIRKVQVWGSRRGYSVTEPTILNEPGKKAEDYISLQAATLANMKGEEHTYSWESWPTTVSPKGKAGDFDQPGNANICLLNTKSKYKAFYVYPAGTKLLPYGAPSELRPEFSHFPTWNHWPVNMAPSDGRIALAADRFSSSAVTSPELPWTDGPGPTKNTYFMLGLTAKPASELALLARSWLQPAELKVAGKDFASEGYDTTQRAYVLRRVAKDSGMLEFKLSASADSPVVNPAFVIRGWNERSATIHVNGKAATRDSGLRVGQVMRPDGLDLMVWLRHESTQPLTITISGK